jgi:hypothetical protein
MSCTAALSFPLTTIFGPQSKVEVHEVGTEREEAKFIADKIVELRSGPIQKNSHVCGNAAEIPKHELLEYPSPFSVVASSIQLHGNIRRSYGYWWIIAQLSPKPSPCAAHRLPFCCAT